MANNDAKTSANWLNDVLKDYFKEQKNPFTQRVNPKVGNLYLFMYDAKWKNQLPYWDVFPLVFPIDYYSNGFLGLNLHYLPQPARALLIKKLKSLLLTDDKYNTRTKLDPGELSYLTLKEYGTYFAGYTNCVKRYLTSHVRGSFYYVHPSQWDYTISLPLQKWVVNDKYGQQPPRF